MDFGSGAYKKGLYTRDNDVLGRVRREHDTDIPRNWIDHTESHRQSQRTALAERIFHNRESTDLRDIDAIILFKNAFSSEFDLLRKLDDNAHFDYDMPRISFNEQTCAQVLFGERNTSIDHTISQMLAVKWLLRGNSDRLQRHCSNLGYDEYLSLQKHCKAALKTPSDVLVLLFVMVSISLGEYSALPESSPSPFFKGKHQPTGAEIDRVAGEGSEISSMRVPQESHRKEVLACLRLASTCNLGQLALGELVPGNLAAFKLDSDTKAGSKAFDIYFLLFAIQEQYKSSPVVSRLLTIQQQIKDLITGENNKTIRQAYDNILARGGEALEKKGFRKLSLEDPEERSLLRLVIMGQSVSRSRAEWFARAFSGLPTEQRAALVKGLNTDGDGEEFAVIPLGMHVLFKEGLKQSGGSVAALVKAIASLMRFLVRIFENARPPCGGDSKIVEFNVDFALKTVKSEEFKKDPDILDALQIAFDVVPEDVRDTSSNDPLASQVSEWTSDVRHTTSSHSSASATTCLGVIKAKTCRACSSNFTCEHPDGDINIICGVPGAGEYKAISYVWGNVSQIPVRCKGCLAVSEVPMESLTKFNQLMDVVGGASTVWLDAMSIDQQDHQEIAKQVAVMGDIYSKAECVSVVLPASDKEVFLLLTNVIQDTERIQSSRMLFTTGNKTQEHEDISVVCKRFFANISAMSRHQNRWVYWRRAWTFQEWALASDLEIGCEGFSDSETKLTDVKTKILSTALFLARYSLATSDYSSVDIGFPRGYVPDILRVVKRLFPREDLFLSGEEIDPEEYLTQTVFPHGQINQLLGTRESHQLPGFRSRLSLMLDAFGGNERQARFEADLVCCWASMCNINYAYDKQDSRAVALQKVMATLRRDGLRIFNFHINTGARLEVDLQFGDYAMSHQLCNSRTGDFLTQAPVFSGRTDTVFHLLHALKQSGELVPLTETPIALRPVVQSPTTVIVELSDQVSVAQQMGPLIQGALNDRTGMIYNNILVEILQALEGLPRTQLDKFVLVVADIPITSMYPWKNGSRAGKRKMPAWAICPRNLRAPHSSLKVAREALNGTLVLADALEGMPLQAVAYLTIIHAQCGSYLLVADDQGMIEVDFVTPKRSDMMLTANGQFPQDSVRVRVKFED